MADDNNEFKNF